MNVSKPPPFFELGALPFQEFCRDMLREDPAVKSCIVYGKNGQGQFGIDIEAALEAGGCWTAQAKAYEKFDVKHLRAAADEFWKHRQRWSKRAANRFIVIVGSGVEDTKVWDEVPVQKERFATGNIDFDVWDSREIVSRLRMHRSIVERHCPIYWAEIICGKSAGFVAAATSCGQSLGLALPLVDEISGLRDRRLAEIRDLVRAGKELSAEGELEEMCKAPSWPSLDPKVRVRALRQRIGLMLGRRKDVAGATVLLAEARAIASGISLKIPEALIAFHSAGAEEALKILEQAGDLDEWNLHLALLLNLGRSTEVLRELDAPRFPLDAETWRLRAVALVLAKNLPGARLAIEKALALNPSWRRLNEAAAVIDYYSALSPAVDAWLNLEWPVPPDWVFVRRDDESVAALRRAADRFAVLVAAPEITEFERRGLEVWHLAALANDPSRESEAAALARSLLLLQPDHIRAAIWATQRAYEFDRARVRAALERKCGRALTTIEPVQALFSLLVLENDIESAGRLLDAHRALYEERGALSIWRFERAQTLMASNRREQAEALVAEESDEKERGKVTAAVAKVAVGHGGNREAVAKTFAERYETTHDARDLFAACEAHLFCGEPAYVASHAANLVRVVGTETALRLALDGSFAAGGFDLCLELLDLHLGLFPKRNPPPVVHRLRVECLRRTGRFVEAQRAAEALAREAGESMDLLAVFEAQRSTGDMSAAATTARTLMSRSDITPEGLLHLSLHLHVDAPEVAKEAFQTLLHQGVESTQQAAFAAHVGFTLGFDDQLGPLLTQAISAAGQPNSAVKLGSFPEVMKMMAEGQSARAESASAYGRGEKPVHLYAVEQNVPLVSLFRATLLMNQATGLPADSFATMTRHGSRDKPRAPRCTKASRLYVDVTSYLLACQIDMLDALEAEFSPIQVSPHLPSCLQSQLMMLANEQVSRQAPREEVLGLIAEQRINVLERNADLQPDKGELGARMGARWCGLLAHTVSEDGYLVDFLPLRSNDLQMDVLAVPPEVQQRLRNCGDLVYALRQCGSITAEQHHLALSRLGSDGVVYSASSALPADTFVALESTIAENLAYAGVLRALTRLCRVSIDVEEHRRLLAESEGRRQRTELVAWLRQLRDRLRRGLEDGRYALKGNAQLPEQQGNFTATPEGRCLWDLLDDARAGDIWTCCDDRFVGRFERVGASPLLDLFDLLHELRRRKRLSDEEFFARIDQLRAGNVRYLPIEARELVHHLGRAPIGDNGLIETPELATLRRYGAACVLDTERLQRPPAANPKGLEATEIRCPIGFYSAGTEALLLMWKDESVAYAKLQAKSDWLLHQLLFDLGGALRVWGGGNLEVAPDIAGLSEAHLIFRSIVLVKEGQSIRTGEQSRQETFIRWVLSRMEPDPARLRQIGAHLHRLLLAPVHKARSRKGRYTAIIISRELYIALPQELQRAAGLNGQDLANLHLEQWRPLNFGRYSFDLGEFWRVAERAQRGRAAVLTARTPARTAFDVRVQMDGNRLSVLLASPESGETMRISDLSLVLIQSDVANREFGIFAQRQVLDVAEADARQRFPRIARLKNLQERMRQYYELRDSSLFLHFASITERLANNHEIGVADLVPNSPESILRFVRLPKGIAESALRESLESAAEVLVAEEGFDEAFLRIATSPVMLPNVLVNAFDNLEAPYRDEWKRKAFEQIKTPIMRLHVANLLLRGPVDDEHRAVDILCSFASDEGAECFEAFDAVLTWTYRELTTSGEQGLSIGALLTAVWSYGTRLHQMLSGRVAQADILRSFEEGAKARPRELLRFRQDVWCDIAGPNLIHNARLAVFGMASLLADRSLQPDSREKLGAALRKLCFPFSENTTLPALPLLKIRATQSNVLGSFLAVCRTEVIGQYIGAEEAERFSDNQIHRELEQVIARLAEQPNDINEWVNATAYLGANEPSAELRQRFRRCLLATDWTHFSDARETTREGIVLFLIGQAGNFSDDEVQGHFRLQLVLLTRRLATVCRSRSEIAKAAHLLANAAHFLAISRGKDDVRAQALVSILSEVCNEWPNAAKDIWRLNWPLLHRQPGAIGTVLWPLILRLRATSERCEN